ncbi:hypothetical protein Cgig2_012716 [Carnegiea gigantea]|uniref:Uncharacterized protein n=1 Tax=Carnegiea gigantea TaxID=171969 RepID=A0A9Q1GP46_9CARY|nr:hypothetical protein Cgig2_012716 [Carnegiea gigantea]
MRESCNRENGAYCHFHPKEILLGVCPLCLNERLLILAAKQGLHSKSPTERSYSAPNDVKSKPSISSGLPKIFGFRSLLHRRDVRHRRRRKSELQHEFLDFANDLDTTSTSLEDESFISIKFGDNGMPLWEKSTNTVTLEHCSMSWAGQTFVKDNNAKNIQKGNIGNNNNNNNQSMVEHGKPQATVLRWRKRIGQLLQVIRWRRTTKGNVGGESSEREGVMKVGRNDKGWMRTLMKRAK